MKTPPGVASNEQMLWSSWMLSGGTDSHPGAPCHHPVSGNPSIPFVSSTKTSDPVRCDAHTSGLTIVSGFQKLLN